MPPGCSPVSTLQVEASKFVIDVSESVPAARSNSSGQRRVRGEKTPDNLDIVEERCDVLLAGCAPSVLAHEHKRFLNVTRGVSFRQPETQFVVFVHPDLGEAAYLVEGLAPDQQRAGHDERLDQQLTQDRAVVISTGAQGGASDMAMVIKALHIAEAEARAGAESSFNLLFEAFGLPEVVRVEEGDKWA